MFTAKLAIPAGFLAACAIGYAAELAATSEEARQLHVVTDVQLNAARFTPAGDLLRPDDLDRWVLLGASLGLGYDEAKPNPDTPGNFQVVLMEPKAYDYFRANGKYADGSMFLLSIYGTQKHQSQDRTGFSQTELLFFEIHLIDKQRYADGRAFFVYKKEERAAKILPAGNDCVQCHVKNAAFGGTFAQFYPTLKERIPQELLRGKH